MSLSREEIRKIAHDAGLSITTAYGEHRALERFYNAAYAAGAAAEREACAEVCEELVVHEPKQEHPLFIAGQHRAKRNCADAIRARGNGNRGEK